MRLKINFIKIALCVCTIFCTLKFSAQTVGNFNQLKSITAINWDTVEKEFYKLLNDLRIQKKLQPLVYGNHILDTAAFDQAAYMHKHKEVGHEQSNRKKATPLKRVQYYGGSFNIVGENCILIFINTPMKTKYNKVFVTVNTETEIATALFLGWKNSVKHYKNMITPEYETAGLGYFYDESNNELYCTQVFGGNFVQK